MTTFIFFGEYRWLWAGENQKEVLGSEVTVSAMPRLPPSWAHSHCQPGVSWMNEHRVPTRRKGACRTRPQAQQLYHSLWPWLENLEAASCSWELLSLLHWWGSQEVLSFLTPSPFGILPYTMNRHLDSPFNLCTSWECLLNWDSLSRELLSWQSQVHCRFLLHDIKVPQSLDCSRLQIGQ